MAKSPKQFLAEFGNRVSIVTNKVAVANDMVLSQGSDFYLQPNAGIYANGTFGSPGQVLTTNGTSAYWGSGGGGGGSVNTDAQYTWTNTHIFEQTVTLEKNADLIFKTDTGNTVVFTQQGDDNFVMYRPLTNGAFEPVLSVFSNPNNEIYTKGLNVTIPLNLTAGIIDGYAGNTGNPGDLLSSTGTGVKWVGGGAASVNTALKYTWTNNHVFENAVLFNNTDATDGILAVNGASYSIIAQYVNGAPVGGWYSFPSFTTFGTTKGGLTVQLTDGSASVNSAGANFTFPTTTGSVGQVLSTDGTGKTSWVPGGSGGNVNTYAEYVWLNNHTFNDKLIVNNTDGSGGELAVNGASFSLISQYVNGVGVGGWYSYPNFTGWGTTKGNITILTDGTVALSSNNVKLQIPKTQGITGSVLVNDGTGNCYWGAGGGSVNTAAEYTWTNNHTFNDKVIINNTDSTNNEFAVNGSSYSIISQYVNGVGVGGWYSYPTTTSFGTTKGTLTVATDGTVAVSSNGINFTFPKIAGTAGQILSTDGTGKTSWIAAPSGGVNTAAQYTWTNTHNFNSKVTFNNVTTSNPLDIKGNSNNIVTQYVDGTAVGSWFSFPSLTAIGTTRGYIQFLTGSGAGGASVLTNNANVNFTFPSTNGTAGQILSTDGTGKTSWIAASSGGVNTAAEYTWTNNHTFNDKVTFNNTDTANGMLAVNGASFALISQYVNGAPIGGWYSYPSFTAIGTTKGQFRVTLADGSAGVSSRSNTAYFGFPASNGTSGQVLSTDGSGVTSWITVSPGGGVNTAAQYVWTNNHTFNGKMTVNNTDAAGGMLAVNGASFSMITQYVGGASLGSWYSQSNYTTLATTNGSIHITNAGTITANNTTSKFVFPKTNGTSGQVLSTDGTGVTSWITSSGGTAPGNKGPITVTNDATWSLNNGVVTDGNLAGSISASKLAGGITVDKLSGGHPTWYSNGSILVSSGTIFAVDSAASFYRSGTVMGFATSGSAYCQLSGPNLYIAGTYNPASDIKLKKNILYIDKKEAIDKIRLLQGVTYDRTDIDNDKRQMGFIANDVEPIIPELVSESNIAKEGETPNIIKTLNYDGMTAVLCEAVKHLDDENKTLKEELTALRQEVKALLKKQSK